MSQLPQAPTVCVYASSSRWLDASYSDGARALGEEIGRRGWTLIYGAGHMGLMGEVARGVHAHGGRVVGVIPSSLEALNLAYTAADELIVTDGMRERKAIMENRADGFIALPGGYGTLEELLEVLVLKQLAFHVKPIVLLNINGFWDGLMPFFGHLANDGFLKESHLDLFQVTESPAAALDAIASPMETELEPKY